MRKRKGGSDLGRRNLKKKGGGVNASKKEKGS